VFLGVVFPYAWQRALSEIPPKSQAGIATEKKLVFFRSLTEGFTEFRIKKNL